MKLLQNIAVFFLGIIFLVSATGVLIFKSHCLCLGNEMVSVYVSPESCEDTHAHHSHIHAEGAVQTTAGDCHECNNHTDDCGCDSPDVHFLKLDYKVVQEKLRIEKIQPVQLNLAVEMAVFLFSLNDYSEAGSFHYNDPPPIFDSSTDFLILINELKIPSLA